MRTEPSEESARRDSPRGECAQGRKASRRRGLRQRGLERALTLRGSGRLGGAGINLGVRIFAP